VRPASDEPSDFRSTSGGSRGESAGAALGVLPAGRPLLWCAWRLPARFANGKTGDSPRRGYVHGAKRGTRRGCVPSRGRVPNGDSPTERLRRTQRGTVPIWRDSLRSRALVPGAGERQSGGLGPAAESWTARRLDLDEGAAFGFADGADVRHRVVHGVAADRADVDFALGQVFARFDGLERLGVEVVVYLLDRQRVAE